VADDTRMRPWRWPWLRGKGDHARDRKCEIVTQDAPGAVCVQWKRCGKAGCRCARGQLHGPYFARFWRENGRLRKAYISKEQVADVRRRCLARRQAHVGWQAAMQEWRELAAFLKGLERP
jgi:hypothetical protein